MTLKELLVKVGFKVDGEKQLHGAEKALEGIKRNLEFLTTLELAKTIYELSERFAHFAEEIHIAALSAGISAEAFQKLAFAAGQNAVSQDEMSASMARLSRHLYDARKGGAEAAKVFADAGFTSAQVDSFRTGSDVMLALADKFKNTADPIKKQAIAMELMGRGSINMVGFLSKGSAAIKDMGNEAERLGIVLSSEQVEALVEVEHSLQKLWGTVKGFSATIAALFGPSITFIIDKMLKFYEVNHKILQEGIESWAHKFAYTMGFIYGLVEDVAKAFFKFADSHRSVSKGIFTVISSFVGLISVAVIAIKVFSFFHSTFGQLMSLFSVVGKVWSFIKLLREWSVVVRIASAMTWLWNAAMSVLGAEVAVIGAPVWLIVAAIAALVVGIHDLYIWLFKGGSFSDTWIGKAAAGLKGAGSWVGKLVGIGDESSATSKTSALEDLKSSPGALAGANSSSNSYEVNAPISITVPPGADHKQVSQSVKEGVAAHLDRVYRETSRSLRPTEAY